MTGVRIDMTAQYRPNANQVGYCYIRLAAVLMQGFSQYAVGDNEGQDRYWIIFTNPMI